MIERDVTFNEIELVGDLGLIYSSFSETLPVPKVVMATIPYGTDLDLTESLGEITYGDGTHVFVFLCYGATEALRIAKKDATIALLHGQRSDYELSWQQGVTYNGRAKVDVTHLSELADLLTVTISYNPNVERE